MKRLLTVNTFGNGLIMDINPLMTPKNVLVNALNATIHTNNGNEGALLNDMGNALVETAFLPEGYAPIGTCEYGGIIYIVSYNPLTKHTQVGSFPSPETNFTSEELGLKNVRLVSDSDFVKELSDHPDSNISKLSRVVNNLPTHYITQHSKLVEISEKYLTAGDKYMPYRDTLNIGTAVKDLDKVDADYYQRKYIKITPVSVEESGRIIELTDYTEYDLGTYYGDDKFFILGSSPENSGGSTTTVETYRMGVSNLESNYSIFSSKIPGKLGLKFQLLDLSTFSVNYAAALNASDSNKFDIIWNFSWEGEGDPDYILCVENTLEEVSASKQSFPYTFTLTLGPYSDPLKATTLSVTNTKYTKFDLSWVYDNDSSKALAQSYEYQYDDNHDIRLEKGSIGDNLLNKYQGVVYKRQVLGYEGGNNGKIRTFTFYPVMPYGVDLDLAQTITIDFSKLYSGEASMNMWKYLKDGNNLKLNFNLDLYPLLHQEVSRVVLDFYDNQSYLAATYELSERNGYSGNYEITIPLDILLPITEMSVDSSEYLICKHLGSPILDVDTVDKTSKVLDDDGNPITYNGSLWYNDFGTVYSNWCYVVKIKVYTKLPQAPNDSVWKTFEKVLWTNGIFNDYYYTSDYSDFTDILPILYCDSGITFTVTKETVNPITEDDEGNDIYKINKSVTYDVSAVINPGLLEDFNTFSVDKDVFLYKVYKSESDECTRDSYTVVSDSNKSYNDDYFLNIDAPTLQIRGLTVNNNQGSVNYVISSDYEYANDDEATATTDEYIGSGNFKYSATLNLPSYYYKQDTGNKKTYPVLNSLIYYKSQLSQFGLDITGFDGDQTRNFQIPIVYWFKADVLGNNGDDKRTYFSNINDSSSDGILLANAFDGDVNSKTIVKQKHEGSSLITSYQTTPSENRTAGEYYTLINGDDNCAKNINRIIGNKFVLLCPTIIKKYNLLYGITESNINKDRDPDYYIKVDAGEVDSKSADNLIPLALGYGDTSGNIHLTNTFYKPLSPYTQTKIKAGNEIASLLSLLFVYASTKQVSVYRTIYMEQHNALYQHYFIVQTSCSDSSKITVRGTTTWDKILNGSDESATPLTGLKSNISSDSLTTLNKNLDIVLESGIRAYPVKYILESEIPEVENDYNVIVNALDGTYYLTGTVSPNTLYQIDSDSIYKVTSSIQAKLINSDSVKENDGVLSATFSDNIISCSNFSQIFDFGGKSLRLSHNKYDTEASYFTYNINRTDVESNEHIHTGGWTDCRLDEEIVDGRNYIEQWVS